MKQSRASFPEGRVVRLSYVEVEHVSREHVLTITVGALNHQRLGYGIHRLASTTQRTTRVCSAFGPSRPYVSLFLFCFIVCVESIEKTPSIFRIPHCRGNAGLFVFWSERIQLYHGSRGTDFRCQDDDDSGGFQGQRKRGLISVWLAMLFPKHNFVQNQLLLECCRLPFSLCLVE